MYLDLMGDDINNLNLVGICNRERGSQSATHQA